MSRKALVVGINHYQDHNLCNLKAPGEDAEAIAQMLENYGNFQVERLPEAIETKPEAVKSFAPQTRALSLNQLKEALVKLFKPKGKRIPDTALFYFSGYGIREDQGIQSSFLATSDVSPQLGFSGLSLQWLRRLLQASSVRQQVIWLDCCHSGTILNFHEAEPERQSPSSARCLIGSFSNFEPSSENLGTRYSVLTKLLLSGLDPNRCPQKRVTNHSLIEFIKQNLDTGNQRLVFTNFGQSINLTCSLDGQASVAKGEDSQDICPYKGLEYFDFNDEDPKYFYGREKLTDQLLERVRQSNFLAILGASGSGKSSLLRAGLLHQLKVGKKLASAEDWKIKIMLPGAHPLQSLALSWLKPNLSNAERDIQLDQTKSLLEKGSEGLSTLVRAAQANRILVVIDQFEEVFTLCQDLAEREAFLRCLLEALEQTDHKLCLILTMRIDFLERCFEPKYIDLGNKIQASANFIAIPPLEQEELWQAITQPAARVNLSLESGLAEAILRDIEGLPDSLPLLQDTLTELWHQRSNNQLRLPIYSQLGGIRGNLDQRATAIYNSFNSSEQDAVQHIFLSLTQLGERGKDLQRRVMKQDLITAKYNEQLIDKVVHKLVRARLIVTRKQVDSNSAIGKEVEVEVAHEALMRNWLLLRHWLDESREQLRQQRKIEELALQWQASGRKTHYLLAKKRLRSARELQKDLPENYPLSPLAKNFLARSINYQTNEWLKSLGLLVIMPLIGTVIGVFFLVREIQFNGDWQLIQECSGKEYCPGRISALERLVKTSRSLPSHNLRGAFLSRADLRRANLSHADLVNTHLINADLRWANLRKAFLVNANLRFTNLSHAQLVNADLRLTNLRDAFLVHANLEGANLRDAFLVHAHLEEANLSRTFLSRTDLSHSFLLNANFEGANLRSANLVGAKLEGSNLKDASLRFANLRLAYLIEVQNLTPLQIKSACYWEQALYKGNWDNDNSAWIVDEQANQQYIEELQQEQDSTPQEPVDCFRWEIK